MISPEYHQKITQNDFMLSSSMRVQVEMYRMQTQHMVKVKYWIKNDLSAITFSVPITTYPWFHPNDCSTITNRLALFNISCKIYDILDTILHPLETTPEEDNEWVTMSAPTKDFVLPLCASVSCHRLTTTFLQLIITLLGLDSVLIKLLLRPSGSAPSLLVSHRHLVKMMLGTMKITPFWSHLDPVLRGKLRGIVSTQPFSHTLQLLAFICH
ncbi:hypothetical protein B0H19DRAFT_1248619 [Mycena capillaripes]|nr:hypothetical protein B0H19DRAFT_1248619 [Mycena capillaripes]